MAQLSWLITGASSGLGAQLAIAALERGHKVFGTARNIEKARLTYPAIEKLGGQWVQLDVTSPNTQNFVTEVARDRGVNVVVNNAGYALKSVLEEASMEDVRAQMESNFFACVAVAKGAIPVFREKRFGCIVNISSTSGMVGMPGYGVYAASEFALEGLSEALSIELAPFNIRVLVVQPGSYRTNFQAAVQGLPTGVGEVYQGTPADLTMRNVSSMNGKQPGDPVKAAQAMVEVVTETDRGHHLTGILRLPLGCDAVQKARDKAESLKRDVEMCRSLSEWAVHSI